MYLCIICVGKMTPSSYLRKRRYRYTDRSYSTQIRYAKSAIDQTSCVFVFARAFFRLRLQPSSSRHNCFATSSSTPSPANPLLCLNAHTLKGLGRRSLLDYRAKEVSMAGLHNNGRIDCGCLTVFDISLLVDSAC